MSSEQEETIKVRLRKSRKAFLAEYLCGVGLVALFLYMAWNQFYFGPLSYILLGMAAVAFASAELGRLLVRYNITYSKIVVIKGFLKQSKKNVYFHSLAYVPDINMSQSRIQRILNYGKVYVHGGGLAEPFEISDIDNPKEVLKRIEGLVRHTRK